MNPTCRVLGAKPGALLARVLLRRLSQRRCALHSMSLLERAVRMRKEHQPNRIAELAARVAN